MYHFTCSVRVKHDVTVTVTLKNSEGWTYEVSATSRRAVSTLKEVFPVIEQLERDAYAEMERLNDREVIEADPTPGMAFSVNKVPESVYSRLQTIKSERIDGLNFP